MEARSGAREYLQKEALGRLGGGADLMMGRFLESGDARQARRTRTRKDARAQTRR
jgi:hypothetical protein